MSTNITFDNFRRNFPANFIVADVTKPILDADLFRKHDILIDISKQRLVDNKTNLFLNIIQCYTLVPHIHNITSPNTQLLQILVNNEKVFDIHALRPTPPIQFQIINESIPKPSKPYRLSPDKVQAAREEITKEISLGRMQRSSSQFASPYFPVKKADGTWRFVADYSKLNSVTQKDNYIPPRIDDLLSRIPKDCVFTKLDLNKAFYQIPLHPDHYHKTAVATPFGLYEFLVMPMGLKNASQQLQRYIDSILADSINSVAYCDDILLFTSADSHIDELDKLLQKLHNAGLVVNRAKSVFMVENIDFLGHHLSSKGIQPSCDKIQAIIDYKPPTNIKSLRRFMGMVNYHRKFIHNISSLMQPLIELTKKDKEYIWDDVCQSSFDSLKTGLQNASLLRYPAIDDIYTLSTDASNSAIGGHLQNQHGPIGFYSSVMNPAEINYSTYDKELLAVYKSVMHFEWLLFGHKFVLQVDHKPLCFIFNSPAKIPRRRRQIEYLSTFEMDIKYLPGKHNIVADALSRHTIDVIELNNSFLNLSYDDILSMQHQDIINEHLNIENFSSSSGILRDHLNKIYVPCVYRDQLINNTHGLSHSNAISCFKQISSNYVWPKMRSHIYNVIKLCANCQQSKVTRHVKPPFVQFQQYAKFEYVHIDFVGPLPSCQNMKYLFTIVDRATRWLMAYPTSTCSTHCAVSKLMNWISTFGVPKIILSDRGTHFESTVFRDLMAKLGIDKRTTTSYHPQCNGAIERQHRRIKESLRAKLDNETRSWVDALPFNVFS